MKKLLLSLGAVVAIAFPVAAMVTCRTGNSSYGVSESDALKSSKTLLIAMIDSPIYSNLTPDQKANFIKRIHNANEDELQNISDDLSEAIGAGTNNQGLTTNPNQLINTNDGTITKDILINKFSNKHYSITVAEATKVLGFLKTNSGGVDVTIGTINPGVQTQGKGTDNHGSDDFLITIKGGVPNALSSGEKVSSDGMEIQDNTNKVLGVLLDSTNTEFAKKWGTFSESDLEGVTSIIYLHHNEIVSPGTTTAAVVKVIKVGDKYYELAESSLVNPFTVTY